MNRFVILIAAIFAFGFAAAVSRQPASCPSPAHSVRRTIISRTLPMADGIAWETQRVVEER